VTTCPATFDKHTDLSVLPGRWTG